MRPSNDLIRRYDVPAPRYTSYPTVPAWSTAFGPAEHAAALDRAARIPERAISLYVHIPFCRELCRFCGCNVVITRDRARVDRYLDAVAGEVELVAKRLGARRCVSRLHFGGGTPTFLDEQQLERLWSALTRHFRFLPDAELAVEVNPVGTRREQLELLAEHGFDRLSMGVQDFEPSVQEAIGREQSFAETRALLSTARLLGFRGVNVDLIYGLPRQTVESFRRTAERIVELAPDRVAIFAFACVPQLKPHQKRLPLAELPVGAAKLDLFLAAREVLVRAGYVPIGMDHFALPTDELAEAAERGVLGRDFQGYTVRRAAHTVALGVTAISDFGDAYAQNLKRLGDYERAIAAGHLATERGIVLGADDQRRRAVIQELMCNFAVDLEARGTFREEAAALADLERDGLVRVHGTRVEVTPVGRLFVRNVAAIFDTSLRRGATTPMARAV